MPATLLPISCWKSSIQHDLKRRTGKVGHDQLLPVVYKMCLEFTVKKMSFLFWIRTCWPVLNHKADAEFRKVTCSWLREIMVRIQVNSSTFILHICPHTPVVSSQLWKCVSIFFRAGLMNWSLLSYHRYICMGIYRLSEICELQSRKRCIGECIIIEFPVRVIVSVHQCHLGRKSVLLNCKISCLSNITLP